MSDDPSTPGDAVATPTLPARAGSIATSAGNGSSDGRGAPDGQPMLGLHRLCVGCGYDLFGSPIDGRCSECGRAVADSMKRGAWREGPMRRALRPLVFGAWMSGPCVGTTLLHLSSASSSRDPADGFLTCVLMTATYALTVAAGVTATRRLGEALEGTPEAERLGKAFAPDLAAAVGLLLLVIVAWCSLLLNSSARGPSDRWLVGAGVLTVALGFALLGLASYRFLYFYGVLSELMRQIWRPSAARFARGLGGVKFVYEGIWLGGCLAFGLLLLVAGGEGVAIFLLFGAFFGLFGYGVLWLLMIACHMVIVRHLRAALGERAADPAPRPSTHSGPEGDAE